MRTENSGISEQLTRHVYWGAIAGGAILAIAIEVVLALLGAGLGLVSLEPQSGAALAGLGLGAIAWWLLSGLLALFLGGWATGRLASLAAERDGVLHGLLTWGLVCVASLLMTGTAVGALIGGGYSALQLDPSRAARMAAGFERAAERADEAVDFGAGDQEDQEKAAKIAGAAALVASVALLLGALVSAWGGALGVRRMGGGREHLSPGRAAAAGAR